MINDGNIIKGRGSQQRADNKFSKEQYCREHEEGLDLPPEVSAKTKLIEVFPKTIINKVDSPDLKIEYSLNPYQGCEHGCIYCYARNSHAYWGYEPAMDFESKILYKPKAAELLEKAFMKKSWEGHPVMLSGNTDCYQPAERKLQINRSLIKVFLKFKNPLGIITKNHLILRDLDLLKEMAEQELVHVYHSITTQDEALRRKMEPRTSSSYWRLKSIEKLSEAGIPVGVMIAPIIPGLNSHEIPSIAKAAADAGALSIRHTTVRLNGAIAEIFNDWLRKQFPDRASKIIHQIESMHGGKLNDSSYGRRMKGSGNHAKIIDQLIRYSEKRHIPNSAMPAYNREAFCRPGESMKIAGL